MKRIIELNRNGIGRLVNHEPFLLPDGMELVFKTSGYDLSNAFVSVRNGTVKDIYKLTTPFKIDDKFLFGGNLNLSVKLYSGETCVKTWAVLPIKLVEADYEIQAFDYLGDIEERLNNIEKDYVAKEKYNALVEKLNNLIEKHNTLAETVSEMKELN